ncbi:protein-L-histidine N-pros-methyltransferase [Eupeodes corollae]|uniref:protein-L-histidine N-pros-methyltransferase n=1 Tax=Eupeodes corollae TaxID=290404 RepID=UPI0024901648|nr:protein-L-histidine N-pros-methyltransferase [Eupeodes corollae]
MNIHRPRGTLARAIFEKVHNDQYLDEFDTRLWYRLVHKLPDNFQSKFVPLDQPDDITVDWLEKAKELSANIWIQLWHTLARTILQFFMTQTDINGFLKRGSMFILSDNQFAKLLKAGNFDVHSFITNGHQTVDILDIGAGDGEISVRLIDSVIKLKKDAKVRVYATETSWTMRERLEKRNFTIIDKISNIQNVPLVACLNVLDRCIDPYELLQDIYNVLAPNGRVIIALVLPYVHYVEFNTSHLPIRPLMAHWPDKAKQFSFEAEAIIFFEMLENFGFKVESWTKAPYLCEGDLRQSFYWLIDLVVVLSKK